MPHVFCLCVVALGYSGASWFPGLALPPHVLPLVLCAASRVITWWWPLYNACNWRFQPPDTMGVPKFYRWLSERYPLINQNLQDRTLIPEFNCLYLDMNGIIHQNTHGNDGVSKKVGLAVFKCVPASNPRQLTAWTCVAWFNRWMRNC